MATICIFVGAMVTILDVWPCSLPSHLPLQPCSPPCPFKLILVCICMLMCMCMCMISTVPAWVELWLLSLPKARLTPPATITFLPCLPGTMLRAPLVSASPSWSPSQCSVQPPPAACRKTQLQTLFFTFYVVHGVSEWQTILGQWPWQTADAALVPTGHSKLYSSQLVSLSLWLNAWCGIYSPEKLKILVIISTYNWKQIFEL